MKARSKFIAEEWEHLTAAEKKTALQDFDKKNKAGSEVALKLRTLIGDDSKFTDKDAKGECSISKMNQLRALVEGHDDKVVVFSDKNEMVLPYIASWFDKWGISYTLYHGSLNAKQKQEAQDKFRNDPSVKLFLSSDAGQDSIDLPEASLTIHYSDPWTQATKTQRSNRIDRIDSAKAVVQDITLRVPNTVEDRKAEILAVKQGYQNRVDGEIAAQAEELRKSDFLYILTGESNG
jgi:SNF2 family DNA or RNA helicase